MTNHPNRSPMQRKAIALLRKHGHLQRYSGGYWAAPNYEKCPAEYVGTPTILALYNARLVDVLSANGSWNWDGKSAPKSAHPTDKLIKQVVTEEAA